MCLADSFFCKFSPCAWETKLSPKIGPVGLILEEIEHNIIYK